MKRTLLILCLVPFMFGCGAEVSTSSAPKPSKRKPASATTVVVATPADSVVAPVVTVARLEPVKPVKPLALIRVDSVRSDHPQPSYEKALNDAINASRSELMKKLQALDPPCYAKPSLAKIRTEYLKKDSVKEIQPTDTIKDEWKAKGLDPNRVWVELDLELSERQVQSLRSSERVNEGLGGAALMLALAASLYGFLRLDAWTKGYLTLWLGLGAAAIVAAALFFVLA